MVTAEFKSFQHLTAFKNYFISYTKSTANLIFHYPCLLQNLINFITSLFISSIITNVIEMVDLSKMSVFLPTGGYKKSTLRVTVII